MDRFKLAKSLKQDEGFKPSAYKDSLGYLTIGYGRMIDERLGGYLSEEEAGFLLENDIINRHLLICAFNWASLGSKNLKQRLGF